MIREDPARGKSFMHESASVHASVRMVGPVVVHRGASVERDVTLVGPTVVGADSRIGAGSTIAHCVIAPHALVEPNSDVIHRVVSGTWTSGEPAPASDDPGTPWSTGGRAMAHGHSPDGAGRAARSLWIADAVKRAADLVLSSIGLAVLALPMLIVAILVKMDSRGPLLFRHLREGRSGKEFSCLKFRTMVSDADRQQRALYAKSEVDGPQFKMANDPRVTRLGRWLRMLNIDELPQLWNVLCGEMSLVGPRPSPFRENQICVPWRRARLSIRPGVTGLWQICRSDRGGGNFHQWIYYDVLYVRHRSLWVDVKILLATILTLGGRKCVPCRWLIGSRAVDGQTPGPRQNPSEPLFYVETW